MALSEKSTHDLFTRLRVRYGAKLAAAYQGIDLADVARDWAEVLDGAGPHCITYALDHMPAEWPPTAGQFLALCHQAPEAPRPIGLPRPKPTDEQKARVSALLAGVKQKLAMGKVAQ